LKAGYQAVYDADLKGYFDSIPHRQLLACVAMRIADRSVIKLIRMWLKTPVVEQQEGGAPPKVSRSKSGRPQGGEISPLLSNIYLHWFDKVFHRPGGPGQWANAKLVRYADDFVVLARHQTKALTQFIESKLEQWMGLELNREKTRIVDLKQVGASLDFLGYTFRYDRDRHGRPHRYLNVVPSKQALKKERAALRDMTGSRFCFKPIPALIEDLNRNLQGWGRLFPLRLSQSGLRESQLLCPAAFADSSSTTQPTPVSCAQRHESVRALAQARPALFVSAAPFWSIVYIRAG